MEERRIVIDTNVVVAALRSSAGASFRLLRLVGTGRFEIALSVPLALEYEASATAACLGIGLAQADAAVLVDYLCGVAKRVKVFYLWRPSLKDPKDDMVLEVALAAQCDAIVTFNIRDFRGSDRLGIRVMTPAQYLREIGELP